MTSTRKKINADEKGKAPDRNIKAEAFSSRHKKEGRQHGVVGGQQVGRIEAIKH
ncbi:MAG: hypothetical protein HY231_17965 [Acidobacteria bacterium]|nr:hypothetical protein [Acidobacteriota bacterium]